jgi:hypothetical protein
MANLSNNGDFGTTRNYLAQPWILILFYTLSLGIVVSHVIGPHTVGFFPTHIRALLQLVKDTVQTVTHLVEEGFLLVGRESF